MRNLIIAAAVIAAIIYFWSKPSVEQPSIVGKVAATEASAAISPFAIMTRPGPMLPVENPIDPL
jgi:hypothetical protein